MVKDQPEWNRVVALLAELEAAWKAYIEVRPGTRDEQHWVRYQCAYQQICRAMQGRFQEAVVRFLWQPTDENRMVLVCGPCKPALASASVAF